MTYLEEYVPAFVAELLDLCDTLEEVNNEPTNQPN